MANTKIGMDSDMAIEVLKNVFYFLACACTCVLFIAALPLGHVHTCSGSAAIICISGPAALISI